MEMAEQLMGVTMHEAGVSRMVTVDVDEAVALSAVLLFSAQVLLGAMVPPQDLIDLGQ